MTKASGWSLTELLVGLAVFSIIMTGVYQFSARTTRATHETVSGNIFDRNARNLKRLLEQKLKNLGYNPMLVPYDIFGNCEAPPSPFSPKRIGLAAAEPHRLLYTSDDNTLFKPDPNNTDGWTGLVQNAEKYGFWAAASETEPAISWSSVIDETGELCDPATTGAFTDTYKLFHRVKDIEAGNYLTDATAPAVLADNVICFEVRYYSLNVEYVPGSNHPRKKEVWRRVWDEAPGGIDDFPEIYQLPSAFDCSQPELYARYIRDSIRLIRVGVVLVAAPSKTETMSLTNEFTGDGRRVKRLIVETRLANNPWLAKSLYNPDGSATCMPTRPCP